MKFRALLFCNIQSGTQAAAAQPTTENSLELHVLLLIHDVHERMISCSLTQKPLKNKRRKENFLEAIKKVFFSYIKANAENKVAFI